MATKSGSASKLPIPAGGGAMQENWMSPDPGARLLGELNQEMTIIMVTHDMMAVSSNINKLACLNETLVYHGEPELNESVVNKLYGCPVELVAHGVPHRVLKEHEGGHCEC